MWLFSLYFRYVKWLLPIVGIAALGAYLYKQSADIADKLTYSFGNKVSFNKKGTGMFSTSFSFPLMLNNNTNSGATLTAVTGRVFTNGLYLGDFSIPNSFSLVPNGSTTVQVICKASNIEVFRQILLSITTKGLPQFKLEGKIYTSLGAIPFNETV